MTRSTIWQLLVCHAAARLKASWCKDDNVGCASPRRDSADPVGSGNRQRSEGPGGPSPQTSASVGVRVNGVWIGVQRMKGNR